MSEINNNLNNYGMGFQGVNKSENSQSNDEDKMKKLISKCTETLSEMAERRVPENNKFSKVFVAFDVPKSRNEGFISISHDELEPKDMRRLAVEVHHPNSDKFYSHYIYKGTKKEIIEFIKDNKNNEKIINSVSELSKRVDEDYN